jgi:excisionase family DNA binding protein
MLHKLVGDSELAGVGIADPFAEHNARPLADHLEDFRRFLASGTNGREYVARTVGQVAAVFGGCGFVFVTDLEVPAVAEFLAKFRMSESPEIPADESFNATEAAGLLGIRPESLRRMVKRGLLTAEGAGRKLRIPRAAVVGHLAGRGAGVSTTNHSAASVKHFSKWMVENRRTPHDRLAGLKRLNPSADVRKRRRALPADQFTALVEASGK